MWKSFFTLGFVLSFSVALISQEAEISQDKVLDGSSDKKQEVRRELEEKYQGLESKHMVVMVLAQQYNKELAELRSLEVDFADTYNLDVTKWRENLYIWDEEKGSFIEREPELEEEVEA